MLVVLKIQVSTAYARHHLHPPSHHPGCCAIKKCCHTTVLEESTRGIVYTICHTICLFFRALSLPLPVLVEPSLSHTHTELSLLLHTRTQTICHTICLFFRALSLPLPVLIEPSLSHTHTELSLLLHTHTYKKKKKAPLPSLRLLCNRKMLSHNHLGG